ncbi:MAG: Chemotaxis protein (CheV) [Leptospirillum sp. Group IV 'UBA BS']|nr:MAG: Chemotaxis protein (CheV) [Leptospirillum sp. Group IV 'UBA BS']
MSGKTEIENLVLQVGTNQMELVDFRIFQVDKNNPDKVMEGIYGVNVAKVIEIIKLPEITPVPNANPFQDGVVNLRGIVIPIINLARWMRVTEPPGITSSQVIVTEFSNIRLGFLVHQSVQIRRVSWKDIVPINLPSSATNKDSSVVGTIKLAEGPDAGRVLLILDFESIVEEMGLYSRQEHDIESLPKQEPTGKIVLVVDDSGVARNMISKALDKDGYRVALARNGEEGLALLGQLWAKSPENLAAIISDVEMPVMDGYSFVRKIKENPNWKNIPVIMNSSMSGTENLRKGRELGIEEYVVKFEPQRFLEALNAAMARRRERTEALKG